MWFHRNVSRTPRMSHPPRGPSQFRSSSAELESKQKPPRKGGRRGLCGKALCLELFGVDDLSCSGQNRQRRSGGRVLEIQFENLALEVKEIAFGFDSRLESGKRSATRRGGIGARRRPTSQ